MTAALEVLSPIADLSERIDEGEYARLLGYPAGHGLEGRIRVLAAEARSWYARHGRPWSAARRLEILDLAAEHLDVEGGVLRSRQLANRLRAVEATGIVVATSTAGPEIDRHSANLWSTDRPDEAYFADRFGAAVVEHLAAVTALRLRQRLARRELSLIPGYSPGYDGWSLIDQGPLYRLLGLEAASLPGPLTVLDSGMLQPKNSLLAVFGITRQVELAESMWQRSRCSWCSLSPCALRGARPHSQRVTGSS